MPDVYPVRHTRTATIASGQTASDAVDLLAESLMGVHLPAAITGSALTFEASDAIDGTFRELTNADGTPYTLVVAASKYVPVDVAIFAGIRFVKVVSGSAEAADRVLTFSARAL